MYTHKTICAYYISMISLIRILSYHFNYRCSSHKWSMVAVVILLVTKLSYQDETTNFTIQKNSSQVENNSRTTNNDSNALWTILDYSNKKIPVPLMGANDSLIIVSGPFSFDIHLDFQDKRNSCVVRPNLTYNSVSDHDSYTLGDGRVLVTFKNNRFSRKNVLDAAFYAEWKIFIIDPKDCSYYDLTLKKENPLQSLEAILPNYDTFDVVMKKSDGNLSKISVTRFDNQANKINSSSISIQDEKYGNIRMIKVNDPSKGYYYFAPANKENKSLFKKLNDKFEEIDSIEFSHGFFNEDSCSLKYGRLSICSYDNYKKKEITCQIIDVESSKKVIVAAKQPILHKIYYVTISNLSDGGVMIVFAKLNEDRSFTVYVQQMSSKGQFEEPVEFAEVEKGLDQIYLFEMNNGSYLVTISMEKSIMMKAFDPKNYIST